MDYKKFVSDKFKPGKDILASLTPEKCELLHAAIGIAGEAGELLDAVKKHVIYNKPIDTENIVEELGDIEFYAQALRNSMNIAREFTLRKNMDKLQVRYANGYSDKDAQSRKDKSQQSMD